MVPCSGTGKHGVLLRERESVCVFEVNHISHWHIDKQDVFAVFALNKILPKFEERERENNGERKKRDSYQ